MAAAHCECCAAAFAWVQPPYYATLPHNSQQCCGPIIGPTCHIGANGDGNLVNFLANPPAHLAADQRRFRAYRHSYHAIYGVGVAGIRVPLPLCALHVIKTTFP